MSDRSASPTNRFVPVSTHHLTSESPLSETTLGSLLERSERLADEAREALPYSFDECTYPKGYLRQGVWSCIDCGERGVCYGCSISCHAEHKLVELWTRRHFRCDCPTTSMSPKDDAGKRRKCTLIPPQEQPQQPNEENKYGANYSGTFCRCGRDYDPETETEAMLNCIACEDWFHESCLNLLPTSNSGATTDQELPQVVAATTEDDDEDDEEKKVLIPSDTYDGLICAACVRGSAFTESRAGTEGWMVIEPRGDGTHEVIGRQDNEDRSIRQAAVKERSDHTEDGDDEIALGQKRPAEEISDENNAKKVKLEGDSRASSSVKAEENSQWRWKGKGDVFLAHGIRDGLKATLSTETARSLPFPLEDEEIYEPPQDADDEETMEQVTERVVGALPRVQAIEALHGYQVMKDKLKTMLAGHAAEGRTVSKEDIDALFQQLQAGRAGARG